MFLAELERGIPFGGQIGRDELYLLPCGHVAAIAWRDGVGIVKTVLTKEQAVANMQSIGAILKHSPELEQRLAPSDRKEAADDATLEVELRLLAEKHLRDGIGKRKRNILLRELGYDPAGKSGDIYRAAYRTLLEAHYASNRAEYLKRQRGSKVD